MGGFTMIGEQIKKLRQSKGLTLEEAGEKCGMSKQAFSQLEKGSWNISLEKLQKIVEALGGKLILNIT
jgi:transcriptional regulator with XRE-family HTH domain